MITPKEVITKMIEQNSDISNILDEVEDEIIKALNQGYTSADITDILSKTTQRNSNLVRSYLQFLGYTLEFDDYFFVCW